jgi:hypothetical protein
MYVYGIGSTIEQGFHFHEILSMSYCQWADFYSQGYVSIAE